MESATIGSYEGRQQGSERGNAPTCPRLVERNMAFHQSANCVQVKHNQKFWRMLMLLQHDWFHVFLRIPTYQSLVFLLSCWTGMIVLFAYAYTRIDKLAPEISCGLGDAGSPIGFGPAFAFSLETCTTGEWLIKKIRRFLW